jgi:hypothetical protein
MNFSNLQFFASIYFLWIKHLMTSNKLRILCLHGYTQNATMFRKKTAVARKSVDDLADFGKR